jgi:Zn-dependent protease
MHIGDTIFLVFVIMFSAVIHEVMHGVAADWLGDKTARYAGRLTLNPIPHLDPMGSVILPLTLALIGSPIFFGWAKPVPYNPYNLRPGRFSEAIVAFAGPLSNIVIAVIFAMLLRFGVFSGAVTTLLFLVVVVNTMLFFFNLIPVPPLDGSKVLSSLLPLSIRHGYDNWRARMEAQPMIGMLLVLVVIYTLGGAFGSFIYSVAQSMVGM